MSQPKTYDGKFHRVKSLIEQFGAVRSAVETFAKAKPEQDTFYRLKRLVYLEMERALQNQGMNIERQAVEGKSPKSAANMAFTLSSWLHSELFPETKGPCFSFFDRDELKAILTGDAEPYYRKNHMMIRMDERPIHEKLGLDLRTRVEKLHSIGLTP